MPIWSASASFIHHASPAPGHVTTQGVLMQVVEEGGVWEGAKILAEHQGGASTAAC